MTKPNSTTSSSNTLKSYHQFAIDHYARYIASTPNHEQQAQNLHENGPYPFDLCVLTARDPLQKSIFEYQVQVKKQMGTIPSDLQFIVICDREGTMGSGSATIYVMQHLYEHVFARDFERMDQQRILLIHCGGFSKRLPNHSTLGKLFAPLPFHSDGCNMWSMLEMKLAMFACVGEGLREGCLGGGVMVTCADDICIFDHSFVLQSIAKHKLKRNEGVVAFAHPSPVEIGLTHGVFVLPQNVNEEMNTSENCICDCNHFIHKPSMERMKEYGAIINGDHAYTDSSYFFFPDVSHVLVQFAYDHPFIQCELDCYGDFLSALGLKSENSYIDKTSSRSFMQQQLFNVLHKISFQVICCKPSFFYHIGTMGEYIEHLATDIDNNSFLNEIGGFQNILSHLMHLPMPKNCNFIQTIVKNGAPISERFEQYTVIEHSTIVFSNEEQRLHFGEHSIISSIDVSESELIEMCHKHNVSDTILHLPDRVFIQTIPLLINSKKKYITFVIGTGDDLKKESAADRAQYFGTSNIVESLSPYLLPHEIWHTENVLNQKCSIWNANLYILTDSPAESLFYAFFISSLSKQEKHLCSINLKDMQRISFGQALLHCDSVQQVERLLDLNNTISMTDLNMLFNQRVDVTEWGERCPHVFATLKRKLVTEGPIQLYEFIESGLIRTHSRLNQLDLMRLKRCVAYLIRNILNNHFEPTHIHQTALLLTKDSESILKRVICQPYLVPHFSMDQYHVPPILCGFEKQAHRPSYSSVQLPVRINLAGGWTDTPPYCLTHGGVVLNMSIDIAGQHPVKATIKLRSSNRCGFVFVIEDDDDKIESAIMNLQDLFTISTEEHFGMHKAVVSFTLFPNLCVMNEQELSELDWNSLSDMFFLQLADKPVIFELCTKVTGIPRGSGLGTSSILIVACVEAIRQYLVSHSTTAIDIKPNFYESIVGTEKHKHFDDAVNMGLAIEQVLSTGGGWQDQIGGMTRGIKLIQSNAIDPSSHAPSLSYSVSHVDLNPNKQQHFNDRMFVVFTGKQRLAKGVLTNVVENHIVSLGSTDETLSRLKDVTQQMFLHMQEWFSNTEHNEILLEQIGNRLTQVRDLNIELSMSTSHSMEPLFNRMQDMTYGTCMIGAGSGGYIIAILKPHISKQTLMDHLVIEFPNVSLCQASL